MDLGTALFWLVSTLGGAAIGAMKGRPIAGFFWGLFCGPFGWVGALQMSSGKGSTEDKNVKSASESWRNGDQVFIIQTQGETVYFKKQTRKANADMINRILDIGWVLQGTTDKLGGRRVLTFARSPVLAPPGPQAPPSLTVPPEAERKCPYCAELIKQEAIVCRYCQRDMPPRPVNPS